jgi:Family of unknown function (DUF5681)
MGRKPITPNAGGQKSGPAEPGGPGPAGDDARTIPASSADPHSPGDPGSVGYGRPPLHSRFKPGQSGNPKGRAKQSRNLRTIVQQVLLEDMPIREGGRLRRMPAIEALVRTTRARAFGDPKALAALVVLMKQYGFGPDRDEPAADLLSVADQQAILAEYLTRNLSSDEADPEIGSSNESSAPAASSTKEPSDDAN